MALLVLKEPAPLHEREYMAMLDEWEEEGSAIHPGLIRREGRDFAAWFAYLQLFKSWTTCPSGRVPAELFFCFDASGTMLGAISIRPELDEEMAEYGGHIAYGIRPSARQRGYGKQQLLLGLQRCRELGLRRVLLTCKKENYPSKATICACGGKLESDVLDAEGELRTRYWISLEGGV